jgi:formylglycine-generating enzyme required for sulfatase activity
MSDFFKKFLLEDARRFSPSGRYVGLAAFGKHPGWDDHVEDLGLETESLIIAKTLFYVNGIGGQIDSGAWERLEPAQQLPAFKHVFLWQRSGQFLIGRLWSSSDGKGRKRYPMVVCLHFIGVTLGWAIKQALPVLAELEEALALTNSADDVRSLLNRKRAALREALPNAQVQGEYAPVSPDALNKILQNSGGDNREGFLRVLYQGKSQLAALAPGKINPRAQTAGFRAQQIRVPASGVNPEQTLLFWTRFFLTQVDSSVPLLLTLPLEANWLDATAGEPESHEFFCLRASPKAVPLVSEVPYTLDDAFRSGATTFLERFQRGDTKAADLPTPATETVPLPPPAKSGWRKWLGVGLFLIFAGIAAYVLMSTNDSAQKTAASTQTNAEPSKAVAQTDTATSAPPKVEIARADVPKTEPAKIDPPKETPRIDPAVEATRIAEEKKNSEAMAAAAKLKAETEAAAKEKEQQALAEQARIAKEKQIAAQKLLEEQQRKAAEDAAAKKKAAEDAKPKMELAVVTPKTQDTKSDAPSPADASPSMPLREMTNSIGMILVLLPSGIWVGKYEVTQSEYRRVMWSNPSKSINDRQPVERVAWSTANAFCQKLTEKERAKLPAGSAYSLPTQKQWEEFGGGQKFETLSSQSATGPSAVGQGAANKFGLFDVLGNVWEWCLDGGTGTDKLLKGGAFDSTNYELSMAPDRQMPNCGFRCVLISPQKSL